MSLRLIGNDVIFTQRLLRRDGFYTGRIDGIWGRLTERGFCDFEARSKAIKQKLGAFDSRSEKAILSLSLPAQSFARSSLFLLAENYLIARIISGTRGYQEQNQLFRIGRYGDKRPRVTNARGGHSNHNFGIAWDIGLFTRNGGYIRTEEQYQYAGRILTEALPGKIQWGGHWHRFKDWPHYQLPLQLSVAQLRAEFESDQYQTRVA